MTATFVLVHGAWHGGWCWRDVAAGLRTAGHDVHTPTLTGLGERSHLLTSEVDLDTHTRDIVASLEYRQLEDVVLVGHSYGSVPATLAAASAPERIGQLVCLDGFLLEAGEAAIDLLPSHAATHYRESGVERDGVWVLPPRPLDRLGVTDAAAIDWLWPRLSPHPLRTYTQPVSHGAREVALPGTYLQCTGWTSPFDHMVQRAATLGWRTGGVDGDHEVMATGPGRLVTALLGVVDASTPQPTSTGAR